MAAIRPTEIRGDTNFDVIGPESTGFKPRHGFAFECGVVAFTRGQPVPDFA
jgi:hypothetical protein